MKTKTGLLMMATYTRLFLFIFTMVAFVVLLSLEHPYSKSMLAIIFLVVVLANLFFWGIAINSVVYSVRLYRAGEVHTLRKRMMITKFGSIPYFFVNFILWFLLAFVSIGASRGIIMFTPIPLLFLLPIIDCVLWLSLNSSDVIAYAFALKKIGKLSINAATLFTMAQFFFVADMVAAAIIAFRKDLRLPKAAEYYPQGYQNINNTQPPIYQDSNNVQPPISQDSNNTPPPPQR